MFIWYFDASISLWSQEERIRVLFHSQLFSLDEAGAEAASCKLVLHIFCQEYENMK